MRVLYHLTVPPSPMAACDAVVQEVEALRQHTDHSKVVHLYPSSTPGTRFPRRWWGLQRLWQLRWAERWVDIHHIFNPDPFPFAILRWLKRPVIYTAVAGLGRPSLCHPEKARQLAQQIEMLVVPTEGECKRLREWSITNCVSIMPGIDTSHFTYTPPPANRPLTLMMGSAPWTREQFRTKGVEALLEAAQSRSDLHLIFLWRGVLADEMAKRVQRAGLQERVEVLNKRVDVNQVLARVHASIVLAEEPSLIKGYPHSLLESLSAGKPILVTPDLPVADYVTAHQCGQVVSRVEADYVLFALSNLEQNYDLLQQNTHKARHDFSQERFVNAYQALYRNIAT